jgi:hypothetical protein
MSYPRAKINMSDVLRCIRSGMDDTALMERFGLPAAGLKMLLDKLLASGALVRHEPCELTDRTTDGRPKIRIYAPDVVAFIRQGADDDAIKAKYGLSPRGLGSLFRKLVATGAMAQEELDGRAVALAALHAVPIDVGVPGGLAAILVAESEPAPCMAELPTQIEELSCPPEERTMELLGQVGFGGGLEPEPSAAPSKLTVYYVRHRESNRVLFSGQALSYRALVESALATGADLSEANLAGVTLAGADLTRAKLNRANLSRANLVGADLSRAKLSGALIRSAELFGAILSEANLTRADLSDSNLTMVYGVRTCLVQANLSETNLTNANLEGANLVRAILFQAIFKGTNLRGAHLQGATLDTAKVVNIIQ